MLRDRQLVGKFAFITEKVLSKSDIDYIRYYYTNRCLNSCFSFQMEAIISMFVGDGMIRAIFVEIMCQENIKIDSKKR